MTVQEERAEVTLKEHLKELFAVWREGHDREHRLIADSVERSRIAMEGRLTEMNGLRTQIDQERGSLATKEWVDARTDSIGKSIDTIIADVNALKLLESIAKDADSNAKAAANLAKESRVKADQFTLGIIVSIGFSVIATAMAILKLFIK